MHLLDVNVWLALAFDSHQHHKPAAAWFHTAPNDSCCFCRVTQASFLRLASNPSVMGAAVLSMADAWRSYDVLFADPRVAFAEEPTDIELHWRGLTHGSAFSPKLWTDAYLAAFAQGANLELVSFDRGFAQYHGTCCTILS